MKGSADIKSGALMSKSKKTQSSKAISSRLSKKNEAELNQEKFSDLELEYEQNVMTIDRIYLVRVFPIFILFIGLFFIFTHVFFPNETNMTLYIGISVSIIGIIWKIIMMNVEKKRKEEFLFGK